MTRRAYRMGLVPAIPGEPVVPGTNRSPNVWISGTAPFSFGKPTFLDRRSYPDERRLQVSDTATLLSGTHLFRFGLDINRTRDVLDNLLQEGGIYSYTSRADFLSDYVLNTKLNSAGRFYSTFGQGIGPTAFRFATTDYAAFIQDTWHARPKLTRSWGLRYDYEQMPDPQIPNPLEPRTGRFNRVNITQINTTFYAVGGTPAAPTLTYNSATFNVAQNANNGAFSPRPREIQLGLRFTF